MTTPADRSKEAEPEALDFGPIHDQLAKQAIQIFKQRGEVPSTILFLLLARPIQRRPVAARTKQMDPRLSNEFMASIEAKDSLTLFVSDALTAGSPVRESLKRSIGFEPDLVVHIAEAWAGQAATMEEATAVAPSQRPDRREVVMISIHHRWGGTVVNTLPIIPLPQRHVKFQPLPSGVIAILGPMAMSPDTRA